MVKAVGPCVDDSLTTRSKGDLILEISNLAGVICQKKHYRLSLIVEGCPRFRPIESIVVRFDHSWTWP